MAIEFYNLKTRQKVQVDESQIRKVVFHPKAGGGTPRYALRTEHEGAKLMKFVNKATYDSLNVPEE